MRKKSLRHLYIGWFMLFSMLFHVLVSHQAGAADLVVIQHHDGHFPVEDNLNHIQAHDFEQPFNSPDKEMPESSHDHPEIDHPTAYTCPSGAKVQDQMDLSLASLLAFLPMCIEFFQTPLEQTSLWAFTEPNPPPEQRKRVLATTILLI